MRIELSGSIQYPKPITLPPYLSNDDFVIGEYVEQGYTDYEVICIGAGGGRGGGIDTANTGSLIRNYGGQGGGGGFQRIQGSLRHLPDSCPIVVGQAGATGTEHPSNPSLTTNGGDGGYSTFNTDLCQASGGKGGKRAISNSATVATNADGGDGGIGNTIIAGGGGAGGDSGGPGEDPSSTDGEDGPIIDDIGHGGGGGAGGIAKYDGTSILEGSAGGNGSYNPDDLLYLGEGEDVQDDPLTEVENILPGRAGGANAGSLTGLPYNYGQSGVSGAVIIHLTAK